MKRKVIEGVRGEIEEAGLELIELDPSTFGAGFLLLGVLEDKRNLAGGVVYVNEFFDSIEAVKSFFDLIPVNILSDNMGV